MHHGRSEDAPGSREVWSQAFVLAKALKQEDEDIRLWACGALGRMGDAGVHFEGLLLELLNKFLDLHLHLQR